MKRFKKVILGIIMIAAIATFPSVKAFAAGSVSAVGDKETASVGDTFTVSVTVTNSEDAAVAPDISVNYDVNRLSFESCTSEYGGGAGGLITLPEGESQVVFTILSGGQADVDVNAIFDGDGTTSQIVTATVMVDGEDTAAVNEYAREDEQTGVEAGTIMSADGSKVVSTVFANEFMPIGFYKTTVSYEEQMVEAAQFEMGNIVLLYVTDADGSNGNFDIYDQNTGELSDFLQISGIENRFIIALRAGEDVKVPEGFAKATLQWNAQTLEAYSYTGEMAENAPIPASDFFLLYAVSSEGNTGWYMYDQNEGTYQRFVEGLHMTASAPSTGELISQIATPLNKEEGDEKGKINIAFIIAIAIIVLLLILIITVIVMGLKLREFNSYEYIDDDEPEGNAFLANATMNANVNSGAMPGANVKAETSVDSTNDDNLEIESIEDISEEVIEDKAVTENKTVATQETDETEAEDIISDKMPKSKNIYEQYRDAEMEAGPGRARYSVDEIEDRLEDDEDDDFFSPRGNRGMSRAEKKAAKLEEKARKKNEKRMKKEFGEFGPVDWQSWQDAVEGGEKTAAMAARNVGADSGVDEAAVRRPAPQQPVQEQELVRRQMPQQSMQEQPVRRPVKQEQIPIEVQAVRKPAQQPPQQARPQQQAMPQQIRRDSDIYEENIPQKNNPMDMMRNIPANDNKAPVQAKPVQQFDFDDDFEFEFLDLDDED